MYQRFLIHCLNTLSSLQNTICFWLLSSCFFCVLNATLYVVIYAVLLYIYIYIYIYIYTYSILKCKVWFCFCNLIRRDCTAFPIFYVCNDPKFISFFILIGFVRRECTTLLGGYILALKTYFECKFQNKTAYSIDTSYVNFRSSTAI